MHMRDIINSSSNKFLFLVAQRTLDLAFQNFYLTYCTLWRRGFGRRGRADRLRAPFLILVIFSHRNLKKKKYESIFNLVTSVICL